MFLVYTLTNYYIARYNVAHCIYTKCFCVYSCELQYRAIQCWARTTRSSAYLMTTVSRDMYKNNHVFVYTNEHLAIQCYGLLIWFCFSLYLRYNIVSRDTIFYSSNMLLYILWTYCIARYNVEPQPTCFRVFLRTISIARYNVVYNWNVLGYS